MVSGSVKVSPVQDGEVVGEAEALVEIPPKVMEEINHEVNVIPNEVIKKLAFETSSELRRVLDIPAEADLQQEKNTQEDANLNKKRGRPSTSGGHCGKAEM